MLSVHVPRGTTLERINIGHDGEIPDRAVWLDLVGPTYQEDKLVERTLGIAVPTREEMQEIEVTSRLYVENGARYMTATLMCQSDTDMPKTTPVTFILSGHRLVRPHGMAGGGEGMAGRQRSIAIAVGERGAGGKHEAPEAVRGAQEVRLVRQHRCRAAVLVAGRQVGEAVVIEVGGDDRAAAAAGGDGEARQKRAAGQHPATPGAVRA